MESEYDIFRGKDSENCIWQGCVAGFDQAVEMMNRLAERQPDDYFVFSAVSQAIIAVWANQKQSESLGPKKLGKTA